MADEDDIRELIGRMAAAQRQGFPSDARRAADRADGPALLSRHEDMTGKAAWRCAPQADREIYRAAGDDRGPTPAGQTTKPYAAAWYQKKTFTLVDAIGAVRLALRVGDIYRTSPHAPDLREIPPERLARMAEALCFAA